MIYGLYHSAAGMLTNEYRQDVLANNLANADTVGFKRDVPTLAERVPATRAGEREGPSAADLANLSGGLWLGRTYTDFREGAKTATGHWGDVALDGPGFLVAQVNGQHQYTRDGRMLMDTDGRLVAASDGAPLLGRGGTPIQLNPRGAQPQIDSAGRVQQDGALVGELEVVDFANYTALRKAGATRFTAPNDAATPAWTPVQAGHVESSATPPLTELVSMMEASHAYQMNARMVSMQDDSVGKLINALLRV